MIIFFTFPKALIKLIVQLSSCLNSNLPFYYFLWFLNEIYVEDVKKNLLEFLFDGSFIFLLISSINDEILSLGCVMNSFYYRSVIAFDAHSNCQFMIDQVISI